MELSAAFTVLLGVMHPALIAQTGTPEEELDPPRVVRDLASDDYATREAATKVLLRVDLADALPILAIALDHRDPEVRARARHVLDAAGARLRQVGAEKAAPELSRAIHHPHPYIHAWAILLRVELQKPVFLPPADPDSPFGTTSMTIIIAHGEDSGLPFDIAIFVAHPPPAIADRSKFDSRGPSIGIGPVIRF